MHDVCNGELPKRKIAVIIILEPHFPHGVTRYGSVGVSSSLKQSSWICMGSTRAQHC
jgi:hypothetical protein